MPWELTKAETFEVPNLTRIGVRIICDEQSKKLHHVWENPNVGIDIASDPMPTLVAFSKIVLDQLNAPPVNYGEFDRAEIIAAIEAQRPVEPTAEQLAEAAKEREVRDAIRAANRKLKLDQLVTDPDVARLNDERPDLVEKLLS